MVIKHFDLPSRCHVFSNGSETDMKTQDLTNLQELLLIKIIDNVLIYTVIIFIYICVHTASPIIEDLKL